MFGLSFLNTTFLWGLAAASLPIIIHLIKRNKAVKLPFAAIRFLQMEPNKRVRSQRWKQILLLLLRIAAILILALAFARPFLASQTSPVLWGEGPKAAVILVDNSYSMAVADNFEKAKVETDRLIGSFGGKDQVSVMQFGLKTELLGSAQANYAGLASQVGKKLRLSQQGTNYLQALQAAETILLESSSRERTIYLISDFQTAGWESLSPQWQLEGGIKLDFLPISHEGETVNIGVQDVHVGQQERRSQRAEILVKVKNFGNARARSSLILNIKKKKVGTRKLLLAAGEERVVPFREIKIPAGLVTGQVSLTDDDIEVDNRFHFVLESESTSQILAINGEPRGDVTQDELFFFERAINLPGLARYSVTRTGQGNLGRYDFNQYRAVVLANVKDLPRSTAERLAAYVHAGGGLVMTLGDKVNPNIFNSLFHDLAPGKLNNRAFASLRRENGVIMAQLDYQHPIFRVFADAGQSDPSVAQFYQYFHVTPNAPEAVIASYDDGSPAILEKKTGDGKVVLLTSTLDTEWNNLPVKAFYLPMIYQILEYVVSQKKGQRSFQVGNAIPLGAYGLSPGDLKHISILTPSGKKTVPRSLLFEASTDAGIYEVQRADSKGPVTMFAVNVDSRESDLSAMPPADLQTTIRQVTENEVESASFGAQALESQVENDQKLWRFAILFAIVLLLGETWLANRTYR